MLYIDTSAFLKLLAAEEHSDELHAVLSRADLGSSTLLDVEAHRAARRLTLDPQLVASRLRPVALVLPSARTFVAARRLGSPGLRSLDAIHLATALELGADLEALVTYDRRQAADAAGLGMTVLAPGLVADWWRAG